MLHLYALTRHPAVVPAVHGIEDRPLRAVLVAEGIEAVVSETSNGGAPNNDAILAHARVVDVLADANAGVLPARFAEGVGSDDELRAGVAKRRDQVLAALDRVDGCVEVGLRVVRAEAEGEAPPVSGREYMSRRLEQVGQAHALARDVHGTFAEHARDSTCQVIARGDLVLTAAYLVPRAGVDQLRAAVAEAEKQFPDVTLVLTGPWPPYSFALLEAGGE